MSIPIERIMTTRLWWGSRWIKNERLLSYSARPNWSNLSTYGIHLDDFLSGGAFYLSLIRSTNKRFLALSCYHLTEWGKFMCTATLPKKIDLITIIKLDSKPLFHFWREYGIVQHKTITVTLKAAHFFIDISLLYQYFMQWQRLLLNAPRNICLCFVPYDSQGLLSNIMTSY